MKNVKKLVLSGLFAALTCVATIIIQVSLPGGGYFNLGDCVVLTAGVVLGPVFGFFASAIGACFADIFSGFALYAPATFIIKGLMALTIALFYNKTKKLSFAFLGALVAEAIMVLGYFLFEFLISFNVGTAILGVPGNLIQGLAGIVSSMALITLITKNKVIKKFLFE